ncbi:MAG: alcohol dehydrogenase catalytic domain-containing protein [Chloroflexi bacterium]|nr:alcohol dehydrogenase catalytic domain-containing protein [Chloroflexota bacterium]
MRVAVYYSNRDVRLEERPVPKVGPGELLVRVEASGICGSDVMEWYRRDRVPLILGHEIAGVVAEAGAGVTAYRPGDRVVIAHHVPCHTCHYCRNGHPTVCDTLRRTNVDPGGFAEYVRVPVINVDRGVFRLPPEVSFEDGSFVEPLACVARGQRLAGLQPGQSVLVLGSGIAGLLHVQLARALGAGRIVASDIVDYRLEMATQLGADAVIHSSGDVPALLRELNDGRLADLVILCTGAAPAISQALSSVERGGTVLFFAPTGPGETVPLPVNDVFWRNEITLTSSYGGSPADYALALELIRARRVPVAGMITHRLGLEQTGAGFRLVAAARESVKVIIEPQK